jgi:antitoxin MazE
MIKTLIPLGDDLGIVIDRSLLDQLRIDRDTPLRITSDGKGLYIEPIPTDQKKGFLEAGRQAMDIHDDAFRKLAQ